MLRKTVAVALAALGAYYVVVGSRTLLHLQVTTQRWIELSGDQDFRIDFTPFAVMIGVGASLVAMLGALSVLCAVAVLQGKPWSERSAVALAIAAPLVHGPWFLYRVIATGHMPRGTAGEPIRAFGVRVLAVSAFYVFAWLVLRLDEGGQRRRSGSSPMI